jgi:TetR/AcrR family transcriptional regulator, mexJK operon transcriptional repressor
MEETDVVTRASGAEAMLGSRKRRRYPPEVRREAILEAAQAVFLESGYAGASIDAVVERSGGSKATVYALFGNKEGLFGALISDWAEHFAKAIRTLAPGSSVDQSLRSLGRTYLEFLLSHDRLAIFRLVAGESGRRPELGDIFYRSGPRTGGSLFTALFRDWSARGLISGSNPAQFASHFLGALRGDLFLRSLFNPTRVPTKKEIAEHVDAVVEVFLRGCGRPDTDKSRV